MFRFQIKVLTLQIQNEFQCAKNAELKSILRGTDNQQQIETNTFYPFPTETLSLNRKVGDVSSNYFILSQ